MGATIRAGVQALQDRPAILLMLADMPDLEPDDLRRVIDARDRLPELHIWRGATQDGKAGHPILFSPDVYADLLVLQGDDGGREAVAKHASHTILVPLPSNRARADLDTPDEWDVWRASRISRQT